MLKILQEVFQGLFLIFLKEQCCLICHYHQICLQLSKNQFFLSCQQFSQNNNKHKPTHFFRQVSNYSKTCNQKLTNYKPLPSNKHQLKNLHKYRPTSKLYEIISSKIQHNHLSS